MIIQGSPEILRGPRGLNGFGDFGALSDAVALEEAVTQLYRTYAGREPDPEGLAYWMKDFGTSVSPEEVLIFEESLYINEPDLLIANRAAATAQAQQAAIDQIIANRQLLYAAADVEAALFNQREAAEAEARATTQAQANAAAAARDAADAAVVQAAAQQAAVQQAAAQQAAAQQAAVQQAAAQQAAAVAQQAAAVAQQAAQQAAVPKDIAFRLAYQSSTGGVSTALFDQYGGYEAVMQAAAQYGYSPTPAWIQNYELSNGLPESAYTKLNKQFVGPTGEDKFQQLQEDLLSKNRAIAEQARADVAAQTAAAEAAYALQQQATIDKIIAERKLLAAETDAAFARQEAANKKTIADAYAAAQAASKAAVEASTLAAKQAADALRVRALVAVKALYLQVLGREGDQAGLDYFADKFGDVIDPDELQIFSDMSKPEIDARNSYLADMAKKSKEDAAKAKAIADQFAATAAKAKADAAAAAKTVVNTTTSGGGSGGISPMLILAAAAAAFFIGG